MRRRSPHDPPTPPRLIGEAINEYVRRAGMKRRMDQASVIPEWAELVGPEIASVTNPIVVRHGGVLVVAVSSSAWMQELQLQSHTILKRLGERGKKIRRIAWYDVGEPAPESPS